MKSAFVTRLVLVAVTSLSIAGVAQAGDLQAQDPTLVRVGKMQADVQQALSTLAHAPEPFLTDTTIWSYAAIDYFERAGDRTYGVP